MLPPYSGWGWQMTAAATGDAGRASSASSVTPAVTSKLMVSAGPVVFMVEDGSSAQPVVQADIGPIGHTLATVQIAHSLE